MVQLLKMFQHIHMSSPSATLTLEQQTKTPPKHLYKSIYSIIIIKQNEYRDRGDIKAGLFTLTFRVFFDKYHDCFCSLRHHY